MRAALCRTYGGPEVVELADVPSPVLGPGQVRVRINVGAVNFPDVLVVANTYQVSVPTPFILGSEYAGTVDEAGRGRATASGSATASSGRRSWAPSPRRSSWRQRTLMRIPDGVDDRTAAAFGVAYRTAYHVLRSVAALQPGEELVVLGAGGGVGIGRRAAGRRCWARRSPRWRRHPRSSRRPGRWGRQRLIDHRAGDLRQALREALPGGADVVVDPVGGDLAEPALRSLHFGGRFVTVGYAAGAIPRIPLNLVLLKGMPDPGLPVRRLRQAPARRDGAQRPRAAGPPGLGPRRAADRGDVRPGRGRATPCATWPTARPSARWWCRWRPATSPERSG